MVKIINMQVDITFIILTLIDEVVHMLKELNDLSDRVLLHWFPTRRVPTQVQAGRLGSEGAVEGAGPIRMKM